MAYIDSEYMFVHVCMYVCMYVYILKIRFITSSENSAMDGISPNFFDGPYLVGFIMDGISPHSFFYKPSIGQDVG